MSTEYWFARMGRQPISRYIPVGVVAATTLSYVSYHSFFKDILKEFYGYYDSEGKRDSISKELRELICEVYVEAREKEKLTREYFENKLSKPASIIWYASSTLEPKTIGMTELKTGALIGLPYFYNFKSFDDIPDQALELKKIKLFRNPFKRGKNEEKKPDPDIESISQIDRSGEPHFEILKKFDRKSELGREYMETLILSDDAKRFSVARELFMADSYKVVLMTFTILSSGLLATAAAKYSVSIFKNLKSPLSVRIPYYLLSVLYGYGVYKIVGIEVEKSYAIKCRDRAKKLGENYVRGAEEYFAKCRRRREILLANVPEDY